MDIALLVILILLNGLLAMAEIALVTARKNRLQVEADQGSQAAALAIRLGNEPTQFLSTVQIGITAISILNGIVGGAALSETLTIYLEDFGINPPYSHQAATAIVVVSITYITIIIGELVPKRLAQNNAEWIAKVLSRPIALLAQLARPFVALLSFSTDQILRLMGYDQDLSPQLTEEDIHAMLAEGKQSGVIEAREHELLQNILELDERALPSIMTPRSDIISLNLEDSSKENLDKIIHSSKTRFPVCQGSLEQMVGIASSRNLLKQHLSSGNFHLKEDLSPVVLVPETMTSLDLLEQFRETGIQMVFVVDEFGEIQGLITLKDLLEALAGEFKPAKRKDSWAVQRDDGSWLLDGLIPTQELKDRLAMKSVPEEGKARYHTLNGMMMWLIGKVPRTGDSATWQGWRLEVVDLDGHRVDKVLASQIPAETDTHQQENEQVK